MRLSIRTKQVLGVTALVERRRHRPERARAGATGPRPARGDARRAAELLARAIYQRCAPGRPDRARSVRSDGDDGGLRAILESSIYSPQVTDAAIVAPDGTHRRAPRPRIGSARRQPRRRAARRAVWPRPASSSCGGSSARTAARTRSCEPLRLGDRDFGAIRIGISTLLVRTELEERLQPVLSTALWVLVAAIVGALLLAQWLLRPIHVLRSGLRRLERGEPAALDLPQDEFGDLGREIQAVSDKLLAERAATEGPQAGLDSIVEHLADAVGIFGPSGELLFANPTLRALLAPREPGAAVCRHRRSHARLAHLRRAGDADAAVGGSRRPPRATGMSPRIPSKIGERRLVGVMVVARDLAALGEVESTLRYSRKLAALGRLTAGVAHEVKNPLNAMTIHLELLKGKLARRGRCGAGDGGAAGADRAGARARLGDRQRDQAARSGRPGLPEVHAARRPEPRSR